jgi:hypothetical protein
MNRRRASLWLALSEVADLNGRRLSRSVGYLETKTMVFQEAPAAAK